MLAALVAGLTALGCRDRVPPGTTPGASASTAERIVPQRMAEPTASQPTPAASASAPSSEPPDPPPVCSAACKEGTSCHLTSKGAACTACAPGSLPVCKDRGTLSVCQADGSIKSVSCDAQGKQCSEGACVDRACKPNALHCFERNVHRCDATGDSRTLVKSCEDGGPCQQTKGAAPACRQTCDLPDHQIVAVWDCGACDWSTTPFCARESNQPDRSCSDNICVHEGGKKIIGVGAVTMPCFRETEALVVPRSDRPGGCEGPGPIGARAISYQVCKGGKAVDVSRVAPCQH